MNLYRSALASKSSSPLSLLNPICYIRRVLARNVLATASNSEFLSEDLVVRSIGTMASYEKYTNLYLTRPIID